jgi:hypothetical protein
LREKLPELRRMGLTGLEPVTLRLSSACSNQLSYRPGKLRGQFIVRSEIRNAISENWEARGLCSRYPRPAGFGGKGDYAPASASDNVPFSLNVASTPFRLWGQRDYAPASASNNVFLFVEFCLHALRALEARGFEPLTSSLQSWRSTN